MAGKRILYTGMICLAVLALAGCQEGSATVESSLKCEVEDWQQQEKAAEEKDASESVYLDGYGTAFEVEVPETVIALSANLGKIWMLAGGELAAVPEDGQWQSSLPADTVFLKPEETLKPQKLLTLEPDLVLLSSEIQEHGEMKLTFSKHDVAALYFSLTYFQDYLNALDICTDFTGRKDLYEKYGREVEEEVRGIVETGRRTDQPTVVLIALSGEEAELRDSRNLAGRMLVEMGCVNIADRNGGVTGTFQIELLLKTNPDYIFLITEKNSSEEMLAQIVGLCREKSAFHVLKAVAEDNIHILPAELFVAQPNERWADSYACLAELLS